VKKGITQEELAHDLGYHLSYIGKLERGLKSPTLRTIFNIADAFGISPTSLLAATERDLRNTASIRRKTSR
jgi:transcriptional regulator with XRE-family HTH domain